MGSRYTVNAVPQLRNPLTSMEDITLDTDIAGSPEAGFRPVLRQGSRGYWGVTAVSKQIVAADTEPGNVATWIPTLVADGIGSEKTFVSLGAANLLRRQLGVEPSGNLWRRLSETLNPVQEVSALYDTLQAEDDDFDAEAETAAWLEIGQNQQMAEMAAEFGYDLPRLMSATRNRDAFVATRNRILMLTQAKQEIANFEEEAGFIVQTASMLHSAVQNYLLTDPTFLASVVPPVAAGRVTGVSILRAVLPRSVTNPLTAARVLGPVASAADRASDVAAPAIRALTPFSGDDAARAALVSTAAVRALRRAPTAAHGALSGFLSHRGARAVELAAYGGAFNLASQQSRMEMSRAFFEDPDMQETFSWAEIGLVAGFSGALGFVLAGPAMAASRGRRVSRLPEEGLFTPNLNLTGEAVEFLPDGNPAVINTMSLVMDAIGEVPTANPIVQNLDYVKAQSLMDAASVKAQRAAERLIPSKPYLIGAFLDDEMLMSAGLTRADMEEVITALVEGIPAGGIDEEAVVAILTEVVNAGRRASGDMNSFRNQMDRVVWMEAMGEAGRSLGARATHDAVRTRAEQLVPLVRRRLLESAKQRALRDPEDVGLAPTDHLLREMENLTNSASLRDLTPAEVEYAKRLDALLRRRQMRGDDVTWQSPFDLSDSQRWLRDPLLDADSEVLTLLRRIRERNRRIAVARTERGEALLMRERDTFLERLRKLTRDMPGVRQAIREAPTTQQVDAMAVMGRQPEEVVEVGEAALSRTERFFPEETVEDVVEEVTQKPPTGRAEKTAAYRRVIEASMREADTTLVEDVTAMGKFLRAIGLGRLAKVGSGVGSGLNFTARSEFALIRMVAQELDVQRLTIGALRGKVPVKTVMGVINDVQQMQGSILNEMKRLVDAGKFGSAVRPIRRAERMGEFSEAVSKHIVGREVSTDPDVIAMANRWKEIADRIAKAGAEIEEIIPRDNFLPRRFKIDAIAANAERFVSSLSNFYLKRWNQTDDVHLDTLVEMGVLSRPNPKEARWVREIDGQTVEVPEDSIQRSDLADLGVTEEAYLEALPAALRKSASETRARIMGEDLYVETPDGPVRMDADVRASSRAQRELDEAIWQEESMDEFLDWNFLRVTHDYLNTTGKQVLNRQRHQRIWGIPGGSMDDLLNAVEDMRPNDLTPDEINAWGQAVKELREKLMLVEGRLPAVPRRSEALVEGASNLGTNLATAAFGSTFGLAAMGVEGKVTLMNKVITNGGVLRAVASVLHSLDRMSKAEKREFMEVFGTAYRQYRYHSMSRFSGGTVSMDTFAFDPISKLVSPFRELMTPIQVHLPGRGGRVSGTIRATGSAVMTIGGLDFFSQMFRHIQINDSLRMVGRNLDKAERLAEIVRRRGDELDRALESGGEEAYWKLWRGMAREAGFGGNWVHARIFADAGLLDPDLLAQLRRGAEATGAWRKGGMLDYIRASKWEEADEGYNLAMGRLRDAIIANANRRISEQTPLQAVTTETGRGPMGRFLLALTNFARSWADNNFLDTASMPLRTGTALIATFVFGEALLDGMRKMALEGMSAEEVVDSIEDDPDNYVSRVLTRMPAFGLLSPLVNTTLDAATANERPYTSSVLDSAGIGAFQMAEGAIQDTLRTVSPFNEQDELRNSTRRFAMKMLPLYNSWQFGVINEIARMGGAPDLRAPVKRGQPGRYRSYDPGNIPMSSGAPGGFNIQTPAEQDLSAFRGMLEQETDQ